MWGRILVAVFLTGCGGVIEDSPAGTLGGECHTDGSCDADWVCNSSNTCVDPCAAIDCGGHGNCVALGGEPQCACDVGFLPNGLDCVEEPDGCTDNDGDGYGVGCPAGSDCNDNDDSIHTGCVTDPCDGVSCGGHGSCSGGTCTCDLGWAQPDCATCAAGFHPDGAACVSDGGGTVPQIGGCQIFPADNMWNTPIDTTPLHPNNAAYIASIGPNVYVHPDFGTVWNGMDIGIPFDVVPQDQSLVPVQFDWWDESDVGERSCSTEVDTGCYPIPENPSIEGGIDDHIIVLQQGSCMLYEVYAASFDGSLWHGGSGAIWDLGLNEVRPEGVTSADAAGLAILPGLVRYEEVLQGEINHALRITLSVVQSGYIRPASHSDGTGGHDADLPPMGLRLRLRADFNISTFSPDIQVILRAMKKYGIVIADTGGPMYLSGIHHDLWDDDMLRELRNVLTSDFEAVYTGEVIPY